MRKRKKELLTLIAAGAMGMLVREEGKRGLPESDETKIREEQEGLMEVVSEAVKGGAGISEEDSDILGSIKMRRTGIDRVRGR